MSDTDPCSDELSAAVVEFSRRGSIEPGLNVEGEALPQLRKKYRILDNIRVLRDIDCHYTLMVKDSFAALERTIQFYIVNRAPGHDKHYPVGKLLHPTPSALRASGLEVGGSTPNMLNS
jgi:hypothetical protein